MKTDDKEEWKAMIADVCNRPDHDEDDLFFSLLFRLKNRMGDEYSVRERE